MWVPQSPHRFRRKEEGGEITPSYLHFRGRRRFFLNISPPACYFPLFPDYDDALQEEEARELREIMEELQRVREEERRRNPEPAAVR